MKAGNATTYAKVIPAVRLVQRKYLCRLTIMSTRCQKAIDRREGVWHGRAYCSISSSPGPSRGLH
jgi:hypothetical protein